MNNEHDFNIEPEDREWLAAFKESATAEAQRPGWFWTVQRARIRERIRPARRFTRWIAIASPLAVSALAAVMFFGIHFPANIHQKAPITVATANAAPNISDQQLLSEIDDTISNSVPDALAPADIIAQEVNRGLQNEKLTH